MSVKKKEILSQDFIQKIIEFSGGSFDKIRLDELFSLIEKETKRHYFTRSSESNLLRFVSAVYDKISFLSDCLKYPNYLELIISLTSNSNYLTDILVRNPEYFYLIANPSTLNKIITKEAYQEAAASAVSSFKSFDSSVNALRRFKRKELLRIGAKDIFLKKGVEEITEELSSLASAIASQLLTICYRRVLDKYKLDLSEDKYCLISLGKLGGNELNYSSDIDLMIFFDENDILPGNKEYQEILTEAVLLFVESASSLTEYGYIYRVDFRLRPDGKNSPLCRRLVDYLVYYESRGEDWERQMLIKCGFVSGSYELFKKFKKYLTPFIYPSSFKVSPLEQVRRLKQNIEKNLKKEENIKLVPGGIRDIEFSVQALQLINGGRLESLRTGNTLEALRELKKQELISDKEVVTLENSYIFYRRIEHYLQLMNDTQTHLIPSKGEIRDKLSTYLGFRNTEEFHEEVKKKRNNVLKIYTSVTGSSKVGNKNAAEIISFPDSAAAERDILYLREGKGLLGNKEFDNQSIEAFDKISSTLLNYLKNSEDPELVLNNFVRVIRQAKFPSIWYEEFRDKKFFNAFLTICEYSQWSIDLFAEDKALRDILLSKRIFSKIDPTGSLTYKEFLFLILAEFTLGIIKTKNVSRLLSEYIAAQITRVSAGLDKNPLVEGHYMIGAMGSLGSGEMTFASDIDLVFVTDNLQENPPEQKIFIDFLSQLREEFKPAGVDCRLRPEGKSGMLVWDSDSYAKYILSRARTWELQAFTKLKFIAGNRKLFNKLSGSVAKRLKTEDPDKIKSDLKEMRRKLMPAGGGFQDMINLKKNSGGLTDIEFISQYLILCNPHLYNKCRSKNVNKIFNVLSKEMPEYNDDFKTLINNHLFIKSLILNYQNIFHHTSSIITRNDVRFAKLENKMSINKDESLENTIYRIMKNNSSLYTKFFGK